MKMYLISDNIDTLIGFRLVGVDGKVVHKKEEILQELNKTLENENIGIVLIVEKLAKEFEEIISDIRLNRELPLVVEIPDRHGLGRPQDFITRYLREAIGIKL